MLYEPQERKERRVAGLLAIQLSMSEWNESAGTGTLSQMLSDGGRIVDVSKAKL